jgi:hypothetical protein
VCQILYVRMDICVSDFDSNFHNSRLAKLVNTQAAVNHS